MEKNDSTDSVSVILPVYNDLKGLSITLSSLVKQTTSIDYEILVIDNKSTDNTPKLIKKYEKKHPNLVKGLVEREMQSSYAARNKGVENAEGDILTFIDSDMWVKEDWIENLYKMFQEGQGQYFGMDVKIVKKEETFSSLYDEVTGFPVRDYIVNDHFSPTCCLAVSKEIIKDVGKFNENLISSGDREFGHRVYENGYKQSFLSDITMYHPVRSSFRSHVKKWIRLGRGVYQLNYNYPKRYRNEKRYLLNPIYYIPPSPEIIEEIKNRAERMTLTKKIGLIGMKWIEKIFTHYGYIFEKYNS